MRHGWRGANFTDAVLTAPHPRTLAVTFDDGFLSVLTAAKPILDDFGLPATVFVPTAFMDRRQPLVWAGTDRWAKSSYAQDMTGMSWDDLAVLADAGWEIGSHSRSHPRLPEIDDHALRDELEASRAACEEHLGRPCTSLAYPYGAVDGRVVSATADAGYTVAAALSSNLGAGGPLLWPRVGVYNEDTPWRFRLKTSTPARRARATRLWPAHE